MWLRCVYINHLNIYTAFLQCTGGSIQCPTNWGWIIVVLLTSHCLSLSRALLHQLPASVFLLPVSCWICVCLRSLSVSSWAAIFLRTQLYYECFIFLLLCVFCLFSWSFYWIIFVFWCIFLLQIYFYDLSEINSLEPAASLSVFVCGRSVLRSDTVRSCLSQSHAGFNVPSSLPLGPRTLKLTAVWLDEIHTQ